jgi:hypothetical protein
MSPALQGHAINVDRCTKLNFREKSELHLYSHPVNSIKDLEIKKELYIVTFSLFATALYF